MNEVHDVDDSECGYFIFVSFSAASPAVSPCISPLRFSPASQRLHCVICLIAWPIQYIASTLLTPVFLWFSVKSKITTQTPRGSARAFLIKFFRLSFKFKLFAYYGTIGRTKLKPAIQSLILNFLLYIS